MKIIQTNVCRKTDPSDQYIKDRIAEGWVILSVCPTGYGMYYVFGKLETVEE